MMHATKGQRGDAVLEAMLPTLKADGFQVFLHPSRALLPPAMGGYLPDAIAIGPDRKIAIRVVSAEARPAADQSALQTLYKANPDWEFRLVYAPPLSELVLPVSGREAIERNLAMIMQGFDQAGPLASILIGWSVLEAAARRLLPDALGQAQTAAGLVEVMASEGVVTPAEADALRRLGQVRNEAAHGRLDLVLAREEAQQLVEITQAVLDQVG